MVRSSLVSVTESKGEFYLLAKIRLSKQNVVVSDNQNPVGVAPVKKVQ